MERMNKKSFTLYGTKKGRTDTERTRTGNSCRPGPREGRRHTILNGARLFKGRGGWGPTPESFVWELSKEEGKKSQLSKGPFIVGRRLKREEDKGSRKNVGEQIKKHRKRIKRELSAHLKRGIREPLIMGGENLKLHSSSSMNEGIKRPPPREQQIKGKPSRKKERGKVTPTPRL